MSFHPVSVHPYIQMSQYKVGDCVRWSRAVAQPYLIGAEGVITAVLDNDTQVEDLTMYDVAFEFGLFTLYGPQLERATVSTNPPK